MQVATWPGVRVVMLQAVAPILGSVMASAVSVVLPVFVTMNV